MKDSNRKKGKVDAGDISTCCGLKAYTRTSAFIILLLEPFGSPEEHYAALFSHVVEASARNFKRASNL